MVALQGAPKFVSPEYDQNSCVIIVVSNKDLLGSKGLSANPESFS
jgi:hypothetical protein